MKKLIIVLMVASISGVAQTKLFSGAVASDEEYKIVIDYLKKNEGRKVGDGICKTLIDSAVYAYSGVPCYDAIFSFYNKWDLGQKIALAQGEIKKGDILNFDGVYEKGDSEKQRLYHVAFVRRVVGDSALAITDQNPNPVKSYIIKPSDYTDGGLYVEKLIPKKELVRAYKKYLLDKSLMANKK